MICWLCHSLNLEVDHIQVLDRLLLLCLLSQSLCEYVLLLFLFPEQLGLHLLVGILDLGNLLLLRPLPRS